MPFEMSRADYHARYGLTTGDMLRLGDTNLYIRIERDYTSYGDEVLAGFGKTVRDGLMANSRLGRESELDLVRTLRSKAESDLRMAEIGIEHDGPLDAIAFHLQQTAEKAKITRQFPEMSVRNKFCDVSPLQSFTRLRRRINQAMDIDNCVPG